MSDGEVHQCAPVYLASLLVSCDHDHGDTAAWYGEVERDAQHLFLIGRSIRDVVSHVVADDQDDEDGDDRHFTLLVLAKRVLIRS
jgi:hypothetical protein